MTDIGSRLKQEREARSLSLEQVQKATRIKLAFLDAIESGRFEQLPGPVQVRGFVRSYASYLGIDPDDLLANIDDALPPSTTPAAHTPTDKPDLAQTRNVSRLDAKPTRGATEGWPLPLPILILGAIVLFAIGGFLLLQAFSGQSPAPTPSLPPNVPAAINTAPVVAAASAAAPRVSVTLTASEHVWVRVSNDGITAYEGILAPCDPRSWEGGQQIIVETGNGAALSVSVNQQDIGLLGPRNRIIVRAWGPEGEVTPPPTAAPQTSGPAATRTP